MRVVAYGDDSVGARGGLGNAQSARALFRVKYNQRTPKRQIAIMRHFSALLLGEWSSISIWLFPKVVRQRSNRSNSICVNANLSACPLITTENKGCLNQQTDFST